MTIIVVASVYLLLLELFCETVKRVTTIASYVASFVHFMLQFL